MNKEYVLKSGMLGKETDQPKVYKERWIVLRPGKINYYRTAVVCIIFQNFFFYIIFFFY